MKKVLTICCVAMILLTLAVAPADAKNTTRTPGELPAFLVGCCFGLRVGTEWNEGADLHWREWCRLIPWVGGLFAIWDGVECYGGITAHDWAAQNGANWY